MQNASSPRIAVLVDPRIAFGRELFSGAAEGLRARLGWRTMLGDVNHDTEVKRVLDAADGCVAMINRPFIAQMILRRGLPTVNVSGHGLNAGFTSVVIDDRACGRLAAEHLAGRGFREFAYFGPRGFLPGWARQLGFARALRADGGRGALSLTRMVAKGTPVDRDPGLGSALRALPRPIGVLCATDARAVVLLEAAREAGLAVPREVAVVGVDNDEMLCESADPPLSSVDPRADEVGREAAGLLERLMAGEPGPSAPVRIQPLGVVERGSSDAIGCGDEAVRAGLEVMRRRLAEGISVIQVVQAIDVPRRTLERRFREAIGHSPAAELRRLRVERARQLLIETDWPLPRIARACGMTGGEQLSRFFLRETGVRPGAWRRSAVPGQE